MHHLLLPCRQTKRIRPKYFWIDLSFSTQIWVKITIFCSFWNDQSHKLVHMYILVPLFVFWFFNTQLLIFLIFLCNFTTNLNKPKKHSKKQCSLQEKILTHLSVRTWVPCANSQMLQRPSRISKGIGIE